MTCLSPAAAELYEFMIKYEHGVTNQQIKQEFKAPSEKAAAALNELLEQHRALLFTGNEVGLVYKAVNETTAKKLEGIRPEGKMVYETVQAVGDQGIWTRTIKEKCNMAQNTLNKCLKDLESRELIKPMRSLVHKSKRLYVLFEVEPAREITGGPWYSEQEFDHAFVSTLSDFIVLTIGKQPRQQVMDIKTIANKVATSGVSKVELMMQDIQLLVDTLVYDGRLEEINSSVLQLSGYAVGKKVYKVSKMTDTPDHLTAAPCGVCPVRHQCHDGGLISPQTCVYFDDWLSADDKLYLNKEDTNGNDLLKDMNGECNEVKGIWDW